jgi:hypothetical protein
MHLQIGDRVYRDPGNPSFGKCIRCKRRELTITSIPEREAPEGPPGFWKVPTE